MDPLPFTIVDCVEHIKRCEVWQSRAFENFGLQRKIFSDIESLSKQGEDDLWSIAEYFSASATERLSISGGEWSWRTRDSIPGGKSVYLDWLKVQWSKGRWKDDESIHRNARHFLDPRFARFMSLKYFPGSGNSLGKSWPEVAKSYRDLTGEEAIQRSAANDNLAASKVSKAGVESFALLYFENRGWDCHSSVSDVGNILTAERPILDSDYVFRVALSLAGKSLLDHIDGWISVTRAGIDLRVVRGGPSAMVAAPIGDLLLPASTYYLTHDRERLRVVNAIAFIDSAVRAMTHPV